MSRRRSRNCPTDVPDPPVELHHERETDVAHVDEPVAARPGMLPVPRREVVSALDLVQVAVLERAVHTSGDVGQQVGVNLTVGHPAAPLQRGQQCLRRGQPALHSLGHPREAVRAGTVRDRSSTVPSMRVLGGSARVDTDRTPSLSCRKLTQPRSRIVTPKGISTRRGNDWSASPCRAAAVSPPARDSGPPSRIPPHNFACQDGSTSGHR